MNNYIDNLINIGITVDIDYDDNLSSFVYKIVDKYIDNYYYLQLIHSQLKRLKNNQNDIIIIKSLLKNILFLLNLSDKNLIDNIYIIHIYDLYNKIITNIITIDDLIDYYIKYTKINCISVANNIKTIYNIVFNDSDYFKRSIYDKILTLNIKDYQKRPILLIHGIKTHKLYKLLKYD